MQFILIPHYILHCRQCPGSVIIQLFRNKTPVAVSSYGTKIGRHIFSACRINFSFVQRSNAAFKLCRRALAHSAAKPRCTSSLKTPFPIWCIAERQSQLFAMTALLFSLLLCVTPPLHYLLPIGNISKDGIVSGDPPSGLCLSRYCKSKGSHSFCHDCPIIFFIASCDPAVALSVAYRQYIQRRNCQRRPAVMTLLVTLLQKQGQAQLFCHDRHIIFFIALCNPAVTLSVAYRQYIQRRNLPCPTGTAALAVADFYNIDINILESPCTSIIIVLFGAAHIYVNRDRSCHHALACICRYSIAVADVVVLTDNVQL